MSEIIQGYKKSNKAAFVTSNDNEYLSLDIRPSLILKNIYVFLHALFLITFVIAFLPLVKEQPIWAFVGFFGVAVIVIHLIFQMKKLIRENWLLTADHETWWLSHVSETFYAVTIVGEVILWQTFIYITFDAIESRKNTNRTKHKKFKLLLLPDSTDANSLRQLRVKLITQYSS